MHYSNFMEGMLRAMEAAGCFVSSIGGRGYAPAQRRGKKKKKNKKCRSYREWDKRR